MTYADITRKDANPIKRYLQRSRFRDALRLVGAHRQPANVVDFGAADGEFCKILSARYADASVTCYEPASMLREEAAQNLGGIERVRIVPRTEDLKSDFYDLVFCMEVFEHLPDAEAEVALSEIARILSPDGTGIIGVPIEVHVPALIKGGFRMARRFGHYDATPKNVLLATLGYPPRPRPLSEIGAGLPYHYAHLGFDHREFRRLMCRYFELRVTAGSPLPLFGDFFNSEVYFVVTKRLDRAAVW